MASHLDLEEQEQLDQLKQFWAKFGNLITWVLLIVLTAYAGWNGWQYWQRDQAAKAGGIYDELERSAQAGDADKVAKVWADLQSRYPSTAFAEQGGLLAARVQFDKGQADAARSTLEWVAANAKEDEYRALARLRLAGVHLEAKRFDEALKLLERAKTIAQTGDHGGRNADMATALSNFGDIYALMERYPESKAAFEQAIAMRKELLGPQHPNVAESLNNYGGMLMGMKLLVEAVAAFDEAIEIRKLEFGAADSRTLSSMRNKAMALDMLKRHEDAARLREEIKQLEARKLSP